MTHVINIKADGLPPDAVYIGRAGKGHDGYFGNPFRLAFESNRAEVLARFRKYAYWRLRSDPEYRARVLELHAKTLACFCAPKPCHGDVLAEYADLLAAGWLRSQPEAQAA